jgi:hypothetical protein
MYMRDDSRLHYNPRSRELTGERQHGGVEVSQEKKKKNEIH